MSKTVSSSVWRISSTSSPAIVRRSASCGSSRSNDTYSRSQEVGISMGVGSCSCSDGYRVRVALELPEKPEVVFEQQADVVDAVAEHRHPIEPEAEGIAG